MVVVEEKDEITTSDSRIIMKQKAAAPIRGRGIPQTPQRVLSS
jgi:hypothetical protein